MEHSPPSHDDEGPPMMTLYRLRQLLDAYGATPERWPTEERVAAQILLAGSTEARAQRDESARLVGSLGFGVLDECRAHLGRDHHQMRPSIDWAPCVQKSAERYFQPPSASTQTMTPSSISSARARATCTTAPEEMPAKIPSTRASRRAISSAYLT